MDLPTPEEEGPDDLNDEDYKNEEDAHPNSIQEKIFLQRNEFYTSYRPVRLLMFDLLKS